MPETPFSVPFGNGPLTLAVCHEHSNSQQVFVERIEDGVAITDGLIRVERATGEMQFSQSFDELIQTRFGPLPMGARGNASVLAAGAGHFTLEVLRFLGEMLGWVGRMLLLALVSPAAALGGVIGIVMVVVVFGAIAMYVVPAVFAVILLVMAWREMAGRRNLKLVDAAMTRVSEEVALQVVHLLFTERQSAEELVLHLLRDPAPKAPARVVPVSGGLNCRFEAENLYVHVRSSTAFLPECAPAQIRRRYEARLRDRVMTGSVHIGTPARLVDNNIAQAAILADGGDLGLELIREGLALPRYPGAEDAYLTADVGALRALDLVVTPDERLRSAAAAMLDAMGQQRGLWDQQHRLFTHSDQTMAVMSGLHGAGLLGNRDTAAE